MKRILLLFSFFVYGLTLSAQNFHLNINGNSSEENKIIDSIGYLSKIKDAKSAYNEVNLITKKLSKLGFLENNVISFDKKNDSTYSSLITIGKKIKSVHLYIGKNSEIKQFIPSNQNQDSVFIAFAEIENFLSQILQKTEQKGFALTDLKLDKIKKKNQILFSSLYFNLGKPRSISEIVINNSNKKNILPKGHLKQLNKKYEKQIFNKNSVEKIYRDFEKFRFVNQIKYPETLMLKDTTKIYVYLEKRRSNNFDGYIGFNTDENNKLIFNGYLDLTLENTIKAGEQFALYWKSDGKNQKTFRSSLEIPYLLNTNFGLKAQINIFKQDSIFQNTKTSFDLGYIINYNTRIYLGYQSTESSDIQNTNSNSIQDYKNAYLTTNFDYINLDYDIPLFPEKTRITLKTGLGKRSNDNSIEDTTPIKQLYIDLKASYTITFNKSNYFNITSQNFYLKSSSYLVNELYRFGGIKTLRGFAENSLQAQYVSCLQTEYRYIASPNLYLHSIFDYSIFKDPFSVEKKFEHLTGLGFGIGLQTKNGLLKIIFANSIQNNQKTSFNNTIISLNYNINF